VKKKKTLPHPILSLKPRSCRWVKEDNTYCCEPTIEGKSWCEKHYKIVYVRSGN